uniref:Uncharacterized protein n=1 Tax=viral metagenome TaxID=1070528 RepID=A0A6M3Y5H0_9ZZZZ
MQEMTEEDMEKILAIFPAQVELQYSDLHTEIADCVAIGQRVRADRLTVQLVAKLCEDHNMEFLCKGNSLRRVKEDDLFSAVGPRIKSDRLTPLGRWKNQLPKKTVDSIIRVKDNIDTAKLYIAYTEEDPRLLYFICRTAGLDYYVQLAEWE